MKKPSDLDPDLTDDRIDLIGRLLARVRIENIESADERDDGWSLGCRAYKWCCSEIIALSITKPWINIVNPTLKFIFTIGKVEVSIYKGGADNPKKNITSRATCYPELRQISILSDLEVPDVLVWAYAVETNNEGLTTNIEFIAMDEMGDVIASRTVPLNNIARTLYAVTTTESAPVDVPAAPVYLPRVGKDKTVKSQKRRKDD